MAVEARQLSFFPPQLLGDREMITGIEGNANLFGTPVGYGRPLLSGSITETLLPMYGSVLTDSLQAKTPIKSDSGLNYAHTVSRKRSRDSINPLLSFLGEDISLQIQQQQLEIDRFVAQHTEKVRLENEESRKRYSRRIIAAVEEVFMKKLRSKEDEIEKIGKLNWALEEKVKSLCIENQIWRELAQSNEATANTLRINLEHVLAMVQDEQRHRNDAAALVDDAQSCCGSNLGDDRDEEWRTLAEGGGERKVVKHHQKNNDDSKVNSNISNRWCRNCGKEESCVLLLPCRHLCLCTVCGSAVHTCPICKSAKNASVHVNLSC